ncbi:MAG: DeoR family transcriptional regulator [Eubacteriales bacterium]
MLAIERRNDILARLYAEGKEIVSDLSKIYNVTEETIRRDLEKLEKEGLAKKTYGGAVRSNSLNTDLPYNIRKQSNVPGKQKIASIIAELINDGDYIAVDASTDSTLRDQENTYAEEYYIDNQFYRSSTRGGKQDKLEHPVHRRST